MADTKQLINKIMSDEKLQKALKNSDTVYRDEPIIRPASQLKNITPFRIQRLKNMMWSAKYQILSSERSFYLLSDYMKDYEDDYENDVKEFNHYLPSYYEMTEPQMRAYFSWRTKVRKGIINKTFLSFAYVYMFELLNLRGADSPEEAFDKLYDFYNDYKKLDENICADASEWLRDFVVYYDLPDEYAQKVFDIKGDVICKRLFYPDRVSDDELFEAISMLSAYDIINSEFYRRYEKLTVFAVCKVYRSLNEYFSLNRASGLCSYCIGNYCRYPHVMFYKALFYDTKKYKDYYYKVGEMRSYTCTNGRWLIESILCSDHKNLTLGNIVEACDAMLREKTGFENKIVYSLKTKYILKIIKKEISSIKIRSVSEAKESVQINIDVSQLDKIRASSDSVRDKLIVEEITEEIPEYEYASENSDVSEISNDEIKEENSLLDDTETEFLDLVLNNSDYHSFIKNKRLLLSVITDSINEKLFDHFEDTVLESDGMNVAVIEDYTDELEKMFLKGNSLE